MEALQHYESEDEGENLSIRKLEALTKDWGLYHDKVWAWRFYYYLREYGILGYPGGLIDQPDSYFYDLATINLVKKWLKATDGLPQLAQHDIVDRLKDGEGLLDNQWQANGGR